MRGVVVAILLLTGGCSPERAPPANATFHGVPITGDVAFAQGMGFTRCLDFNTTLRCRREGIRFLGEGPFSGAVDSRGGDGRGGFDQLILWHNEDQRAVIAVGNRLLAAGWTLCRTGTDTRGDQNIYTRPGGRVRVSIDASYWGKRRLRVMRETGQPTGKCW